MPRHRQYIRCASQNRVSLPRHRARVDRSADFIGAEALQARQEAAKRPGTLTERRAHSRRCLWARRTQAAATQLQRAWRCRVARDERTRRGEAQAALARREEAARARLARREAEVREEQEQRRQKRAAEAREPPAEQAAQFEEAETAGAAERDQAIDFEWNIRLQRMVVKGAAGLAGALAAIQTGELVSWGTEGLVASGGEWVLGFRRPRTESAVQTEVFPRRLHITDVAETGCQAECTRQEVGCQTDACQAALAGPAVVVSGGLAEPLAVSGGVTPKRSGGKQRKAIRQARQQREAAQLEAQQLLAATIGGGEVWQERLEERLEVARARYQQGVADRAFANFNKAAETHSLLVQRGAWEADW